jgi:cytochrome c peroxidase
MHGPALNSKLWAAILSVWVVWNVFPATASGQSHKAHEKHLRKSSLTISKRQPRACSNGGAFGDYVWNLPPGFPCPIIPAENPVTKSKVELGRHLFYDKRLSANQTQSCSSCHEQRLAFTDGKPRAVGSTGESHRLSSMSLVNVAYTPALTWANPSLRQLEQQALVPMFGEHPVELGLAGKEDLLLARLKADHRYLRLFGDAFPRENNPITIPRIAQAIAAFERTIISGHSPYDRYRQGEAAAISDKARRGKTLFFSERCACSKCHNGFTLSGAEDYAGRRSEEVEFHNTGLYNLPGNTSYPSDSTGLYEITHDPQDVGRFRAPSLRNVAITAPYMHDGSVLTLEEVVEHYNAGGRTITSGPYAGVGAENPNKSEFIKPLYLTAREKGDLIEFLRSLTDHDLLSDPRYADPWLKPQGKKP